jgi:hypothetical protein
MLEDERLSSREIPEQRDCDWVERKREEPVPLDEPSAVLFDGNGNSVR